MKSSRHIANVALGRLAWASGVLIALTLGMSITLSAQSPPPVQGTIALEGTMKTLYRAANKIIVTTIDGVEHAYRFTKDLVVHGGKGHGVDALEGLREGTTVVLHYTADGAEPSVLEIDRIGDEGLKVTEGVVARIDRGQKQITIRFENGKTETFDLTDRVAAESAKNLDQARTGTTQVVIYYSDENGRKVAHFFKKTS
jgi:hypothetical protein